MRRAQHYIATNIGLSLGRDVEIEFQVGDHTPDDITLVIGDSVAEISFDPSTVEVLRDKADAVLREYRMAVAAKMAHTAGKCAAPELVGAAEAVVA